MLSAPKALDCIQSSVYPGEFPMTSLESLDGFRLKDQRGDAMILGLGASRTYWFIHQDGRSVLITLFVGSKSGREAAQMLLVNYLSEYSREELDVPEAPKIGQFQVLLTRYDTEAPSLSHLRDSGFCRKNVAFRIRSDCIDLSRSVAYELDRRISRAVAAYDGNDTVPVMLVDLDDVSLSRGEERVISLDFDPPVTDPWVIKIVRHSTPQAMSAVLRPSSDVSELLLESRGSGRGIVGVAAYNTETMQSKWWTFEVELNGPPNELQKRRGWM
jgi:hypothetical protein